MLSQFDSRVIIRYPAIWSGPVSSKSALAKAGASAEQLFHTEMKSTVEKVREGAAEALVVFSGVNNAQDVVFDRLEKQGFNLLSLPQQYY